MWVVVILLLILLILFLISSSHIIIGVVATSIPVWGLGLIVGFAVFFSLRQYFLTSLRSPEKLAKLVKLSFDGKKLNCSIQYSEVNKYGDIGLPYGLALLACLVTAILSLLYLLYYTTAFSRYMFAMMDIGGSYKDGPTRVPENLIFILVSGVSIIPIAIAFTKLKANHSFRRSIREEVERLVSQANLSLRSTNELQYVVSQISSLASRVKVQFPENSTPSIRRYVESHKSELLISTAGLEKLLNTELAKAKKDRDMLEQATSLYEKAMRIYTDASRQVNRVGSMPLIKELEYDYEALTSPNLKSLLTSRKWNEFQEVVNGGIEDLQRLKDLAVKYEWQEAEFEEEFEEDEFTEDESAESDEEKAYRILGVPVTASNEQIKKVYKKLADIYHPDKKIIDDDARIKEINWAYHHLRSVRKM